MTPEATGAQCSSKRSMVQIRSPVIDGMGPAAPPSPLVRGVWQPGRVPVACSSVEGDVVRCAQEPPEFDHCHDLGERPDCPPSSQCRMRDFDRGVGGGLDRPGCSAADRAERRALSGSYGFEATEELGNGSEVGTLTCDPEQPRSDGRDDPSR